MLEPNTKGLNSENSRTKLIYALAILTLLVTFGVTGFMVIEDFTFLEAVYMTVITLSTVGFSEVHTLSTSGQIFTIVLILSSLGVLAYVVSVIATQFFEWQ